MQGFARLAAVYGGTYMLNKPNLQVLYDEAGVFSGVQDEEGQIAKAAFVIGDPSYFPNKTKTTSKVVRAICIMDHPIPDTDNSHSVQVIIPQAQVGRQSDIYVFCSSYRCSSQTSNDYATNNLFLEFRYPVNVVFSFEILFSAFDKQLHRPLIILCI